MADSDSEDDFLEGVQEEVIKGAIDHCKKTLRDNLQIEELLHVLWSQDILTAQENEILTRVLKYEGGITATQKLLDIILKKSESSLKRFLPELQRVQVDLYDAVMETVQRIQTKELPMYGNPDFNGRYSSMYFT